MPTRQTSSSGRPKSPRIQVVLPEELCARLTRLADSESRTVSNMAKVLIQQGVERLERLERGQPASAPSPRQAAADPPSPRDSLPEAPLTPESAAARTGASSTDRFRSELERNSAGPTARLRGLPRRIRLRPPGRG